jgi:REP element-mobilizing transposase RayT
MGEPLAYFLTWTTYGSWLPGDERGWIDRHEAGAGIPIQSPNPQKKALSAIKMAETPVTLEAPARQDVAAAIAEVGLFRSWPIHAARVLSNHVHVVVTAADVHPDRVEATFKAYGTRRLKRLYPTNNRRHWWTEGASTRYLNDEASVLRAIQYVFDHDDPSKKHC